MGDVLFTDTLLKLIGSDMSKYVFLSSMPEIHLGVTAPAAAAAPVTGTVLCA